LQRSFLIIVSPLMFISSLFPPEPRAHVGFGNSLSPLVCLFRVWPGSTRLCTHPRYPREGKPRLFSAPHWAGAA
jgi:hypothetical protein